MKQPWFRALDTFCDADGTVYERDRLYPAPDVRTIRFVERLVEVKKAQWVDLNLKGRVSGRGMVGGN